jgi:hypothetical protein
MALSELSPGDRRIIFECLTAAAKGPFFDDDEVHTIFGIARGELLALIARIPRLDDGEPQVGCAIGNSLNNLLRYPHNQQARWDDWISARPAVVEQVEERWRQTRPPLEYSSLQVRGPALVGNTFYRVIEYAAGGGRGFVSQVWKEGQWMVASDGPGCNAIMSTPAAGPELLERAGVDRGPLPSKYDPLGVDWE